MICAACEKETKHLIDGLCADCYADSEFFEDDVNDETDDFYEEDLDGLI